MKFLPASCRIRASAAFLLTSLICCATPGRQGTGNAPPRGEVVTAETIAASGASTMWDALRLCVRSHTFFEHGSRPAQVRSNRPNPTLFGNTGPIILVDNLRVLDLRWLREMPASDIQRIRVLSSVDGTTSYGTDARNGVILITTGRSDPLH